MPKFTIEFDSDPMPEDWKAPTLTDGMTEADEQLQIDLEVAFIIATNDAERFYAVEKYLELMEPTKNRLFVIRMVSLVIRMKYKEYPEETASMLLTSLVSGRPNPCDLKQPRSEEQTVQS